MVKAGEKHGIKICLGQEFYHGELTSFKGQQRDQNHLLLGAMTDEGLRNIWRLTSKAARNFRFVGRVNWEMMKDHHEGVFATSACIQGKVSQGIKNGDLDDLERYLNIFRENFFIEIHTYPTDDQWAINRELVSIARERGIPMIFATDAHHAFPSDYVDHDAFICMQIRETIDTPIEDRKMWHPPGLHIQDENEVRANLAYLPLDVVDECIKNSVDLAAKCNASLPEIKRHLPPFLPSKSKFVPIERQQMTTADLLISLAVEGAYKRYGEDPSPEVWDRLEHELDVLVGAKLEDYLLQIWDICQFSDGQNILRSPGRGSVGGSIVAYCLEIHDIDPIYYNLYFERFYNAGREAGLPDIDLDFPVRHRRKIKQYIEDRGGKDRVRSIGTIMRLKPKAALRRTFKVFGIYENEMEAISKIVSSVPDIEIVGPESVGWEDHGDSKTIYVREHVGDQIDEFVQSLSQERRPIVERWLSFISRLVGRVSGYGVHASGVVVSDVDLDDELPCFWSASKATECLATMFPMDDVDKRGFMKNDILGLRNLDTLEDWAQQMEVKTGEKINWRGLDKQTHPEEMWRFFDEGFCLGIFQIEDAPFAVDLCRKIKPRSAHDLSIIVALNRPGPIRAGSSKRYVNRRNNLEEVEYDHPFLETILEDTQAEWVFQENVIAFFNKLGYSLSDSDSVRKMLGKKDPEAMTRLLKGKKEWRGKGYMEMAKPILGDKAQIIWDKLEGFSRYSFGAAHACSYGIMAERTAYAKHHGLAEYIMACIRTNDEDAGLYVAEGRRLGIEVAPPDILKSETSISVHDGKIYFGFSNIKGLTKTSSDFLISLRHKYQFKTREELEGAISAEAEIWEAQKSTRDPAWKSPRSRFKSNQVDALARAGAFDNYAPIERSIQEIQEDEEELLGIVLTDNSQDVFEANKEIIKKCDSFDWDEEDLNTVPGMVTKIKPTVVKKTGKEMGIVTIEYGRDSCTFAVFPEAWARNKFLFKPRACGIFSIRKTDRGFSFQKGKLLI